MNGAPRRPRHDGRARRHPRVDARAGFGLIEAIVALAIAGLVLAVVTEIAGRTLRSWNRGFTTMAAVERTDTALGRIAADLAALLPLHPANTEDRAVLFVGDEHGMAFTALTPIDRNRDAIATVEIGVESGRDGAVLTRRLRLGRDAELRDGDRVVLLSGKLDLAFAYRDQKGERLARWTKVGEVPRGVIVSLTGPREGGGLPVEVMLPIAVAVPVSCLIEVPSEAPAGPGAGGEPVDAAMLRQGMAGGPRRPPEVDAASAEEKRRRCATIRGGGGDAGPPARRGGGGAVGGGGREMGPPVRRGGGGPQP